MAKSDSEAIRDIIESSTGGAAAPKWFPVGMTSDAWKAKAMEPRMDAFRRHEIDEEALRGDVYVCDIGTMLRTERGVFMIGLVGSMLIGQKREDGSLDRSSASLHVHLDGEEVIIEAADPEGCRYVRLPSGEVKSTGFYEYREKLAAETVDALIADVRGRSGLDSMWDGIDQQTRDEIRAEWIKIVTHGMDDSP